MFSILIPTYNYNINSLLKKLIKQCETCEINCEIIIGDDCSKINIVTDAINRNTIVLRNKKNIGRTETRQKLAIHAKYDWLLFLDADVLPCSDNFILNYSNCITKNNFDLAYGGLSYCKNIQNSNQTLRLKYGLQKEAKSANYRKKKPFKIITSANLLIKKSLFISTNHKLKGNLYGYDNIFAIDLKNKGSKVLQIENPVWHMGLESNEVFLKKIENSIKTLYFLYNQKKINSGSNDLLKAFEILKKSRSIWLMNNFYRLSKSIFRKNFLGKKPNISLLNIYKLGYICNLEFNDK